MSTSELGFTTLDRESPAVALDVEGEIPTWLAGSLLRTGPAKWEVGAQHMRHWFDGLAMLHRFTVAAAGVQYASRYLQSTSYRAASESGRIAYAEFATDPCRSLFRRVQSLFSGPATGDNANVNIGRLGERFVAMTETPLPVSFDPGTLESAGVHPFAAPGQVTTAHPHLDRDGGGMLNYAIDFGRRSSYRLFSLAPDGDTPRVTTSLNVRKPSYMHSFGLSERWFVLTEFPLVVDPVRLLLSGRPFIENYRWEPQLGTRVHLIERSSGEVTGPFETDPFFAFHHVNAFDDGDEVVVDMCVYEDAGVIEDFYLERLRAGKPVAAPALERLRIDTRSGAVRRERIADGLELPRINYGRCNERPYRYVWGNDVGQSGFLERIVKVDVKSGARQEWFQESCFAGEPVFVAQPGADGEDCGVLLSVVLDAARERSFLAVLDAQTLAERARAYAPTHIPFGFHGQFASTPPTAGV